MEHIRHTIKKTIDEMVEIRHHFHQNPEMAFQEHQTADKVAELLQSYGFSVTRNIGKTGLVGTLKVGDSEKSIGIRADMDALPINEQTNLPYSSQHENVMHACGHDGHTTILLTAARYLAETKNFNGTVHLFFQPAEEVGLGAKAMIADGLFEKYPCDAIYGLHNWPGLAQGKMQINHTAMLASVDNATITIEGKGGHGAEPHNTIDPIIVASSTIMALQTIVARNVPPLESAIISTGAIHGGHAFNIIPDKVEILMTVRSFLPEIQDMVENRITQIAKQQAASFGAEATVLYERLVPALINDAKHCDFAAKIAKDIFGDENIIESTTPATVSEDFAYMLQACPGAYFFLGNGDSANLHNPSYNFDDRNILDGAVFWGALTEAALAK